jgi:glycosyltransferase involved in cell wall biosynthesis
MKITIVLGAFLPVPPTMGGAVEKVWFALAQEFARRGHEVVMVSRKIDKLPREETRDGVRHLRVLGFDAPGSLIVLKLFDLIYSLRTMSILPEADIIVTNTFWLPLLLRSAKRGRVYVHVARYPKGQMRFYGRAARLHAPSRAVAQAISAEAPKLAPKVKVIPYPAPRSTSEREPPPISGREKIMLYVGRVHPEKGVHLLIDAFASKARTVFAEWKLVIVGPTDEKFGGGGESYLAALKRAAAGSVTFAGAVFEAAELEAQFRAARVFVYPSLAETGESFGLAPLEAMTHRCAVLVSNLDCFHDFVSEGATGFIFNHRATNPAAALSEKLENVIVDLDAVAHVADGGYRKSAEYSTGTVADQFLADFESALHHG